MLSFLNVKYTFKSIRSPQCLEFSIELYNNSKNNHSINVALQL